MQIVSRPYDHPDVATLINLVQAEYVRIFGSPDESPIEPKQFVPPQGDFAVGYAENEPVAMGGWRLHDDGRAELKRMYVVEHARGKGYSRSMLAWLEDSAAAAGATALILETTEQQPAALHVYRSAGYTDVPAFGYYADSDVSIHLGIDLLDRPRQHQ